MALELSDERKKALTVAINQIERQHGKGAIMRLGSDRRVQIPAIPTGALNLDAATGVGGIPRGRVTEIYGPESSGKTTLTLHIIANVQKTGGVAAFIDAEHALDVGYAAKLGVDVENLLVSQPDTGEQALEIAEVLVRSGAIDAIVVDSVAALVPRAEIEGEMGDSHVGLQARLMSQALRKLTGAIGRSNCAVVFTNQIREKIGVMWGCFHCDARVLLADGTSEKIGKIVNQRLPVDVLSFDPKSGAVEPRRVVNWFDNGPTDEFIQFEVEGGPSGRRLFAATGNHLIFTPRGPRMAAELRPGDAVLAMVEDYALTEDQLQVVIGGALGDGSLRRAGAHTASFRVRHGERQREYLEWKRWMLEPFSGHIHDGGFATLAMPALAEIRGQLYGESGRRTATAEMLDRLDARGIAVWYGDHGSFAGSYPRWGNGKAVLYDKSLDPEARRRVEELFDRLGVGRPRDDGRGFWFDPEQTARLHELVAPFLHPSLENKLHPARRGQFSWRPDLSDAHLNGTRLAARRKRRAVPARILGTYEKPLRRRSHRFDLEIEGNHTYLVDGVVVHNSPETQPGGRALKFYASMRLDIRRIASIKDGNDQIGSRTRVKVVKNKCIAAGTLVFDPATGLSHRIEEIVEANRGDTVVAADRNGRLHVRPITRRFDQGEAEVIGLRFRDGTELRLTPDHKIWTEDGWRQAGDLVAGDRVARPRRIYGFGTATPVPPDHARLLGYLIGDGYVGGKTPVTFINTEPSLREDAARIASDLGCPSEIRSRGNSLAFSHRPGVKNGVLALCRWAGIHGHLAWEKRIPAPFFRPDVAADVVANLLLGIWESDGYVCREQTGGLRIGFTTASEQLAHQLHWLLLRWAIGSSVRHYAAKQRRPGLIAGRKVQSRRPVWEVRVSGIENVRRFAESLPMWGPRGRVLTRHLNDPSLAKHRGSQRIYVRANRTQEVLSYLRDRDVTPALAASTVGLSAGEPRLDLRNVLGSRRLRRDRLEPLAEALASDFLADVLNEEVWYDRVVQILPAERSPVYDIEVDVDHSFVANDIVVSNCAAPFRQAEFDILFNEGISRHGLLVDLGEETGVVSRSGAWYAYGEHRLGQGRENARVFLKENPDIADEIEAKVREKLGMLKAASADPDQAEADASDA